MITDRDLIGESRIQPHATEKTPGKSRAFERSRKAGKMRPTAIVQHSRPARLLVRVAQISWMLRYS